MILDTMLNQKCYPKGESQSNTDDSPTIAHETRMNTHRLMSTTSNTILPSDTHLNHLSNMVVICSEQFSPQQQGMIRSHRAGETSERIDTQGWPEVEIMGSICTAKKPSTGTLWHSHSVSFLPLLILGDFNWGVEFMPSLIPGIVLLSMRTRRHRVCTTDRIEQFERWLL